ncbi:unnamed protein product [Rhizoctonia solani]|uniref:Uncharacterized protein n=1 Tax=Rhizoctonia solani TaxID=456999 RepID=A0A8H3B080_9AGAM|nr:unnamed protein product [Rhizoctonia solani]
MEARITQSMGKGSPRKESAVVLLADNSVYRIRRNSNITGFTGAGGRDIIETVEALHLLPQPVIRVEFEAGLINLEFILGVCQSVRSVPGLAVDTRFLALAIISSATQKAVTVHSLSTTAHHTSIADDPQSQLDSLWKDVYNNVREQQPHLPEESQLEQTYKDTRELILTVASTAVESALAPQSESPAPVPNRENPQIRLLAGLALSRMERKAAWDESWKINLLTDLTSETPLELLIMAADFKEMSTQGKLWISSCFLRWMVHLCGDSKTLRMRELSPESDNRDHPHKIPLSELPSDAQRLFRAGVIGHSWQELDQESLENAWVTDWEIAIEMAWERAWEEAVQRGEGLARNHQLQSTLSSELSRMGKTSMPSYTRQMDKAWNRACNVLKQQDPELRRFSEQEWRKFTTGSVILSKLSYDGYPAKIWREHVERALKRVWTHAWEEAWIKTWKHSFLTAARKGLEYGLATRNPNITRPFEDKQSYKHVKEKIESDFRYFMPLISSLNYRLNLSQDPIHNMKGDAIKIYGLVPQSKETRLTVSEILFRPNSWQRLSYPGLRKFILGEYVAKKHHSTFQRSLARVWKNLNESTPLPQAPI